MLTALLDAHPHLCLYYEPWNASRKQPPPVPEGLDDLVAWLSARFAFAPSAAARVVGFKETTILPGSTRWTIETVDRIARHHESRVVWIFRDPILCLLSKLDGARKWWGYPEAHFSEDVLVAYLREATPALRALHSLAERHRGVLVQYEALARNPTLVLPRLMAAIGEDFVPAQLEYHRSGPQPGKVMGDVDVARDPAPLTANREQARREEAQAFHAIIESVLASDEFRWIRETSRRIADSEPLSLLDRTTRAGERSVPGPGSGC